MTTPATETARGAQANYRAAAADERSRPGGRADNVFTRKYGPLPGWGWALLAGGAAIAYFWWRNRSQAPNTGSGTTMTGTGGTAGAAYGAELAAIQREIAALQHGTGTSKTKTSTGTSVTKTGHVKVPNVVGIDMERADGIIDDAGLTVGAYADKPGKPGYMRIVTVQTPKAGAVVPKGTKVGLAWKNVKERSRSRK